MSRDIAGHDEGPDSVRTPGGRHRQQVPGSARQLRIWKRLAVAGWLLAAGLASTYAAILTAAPGIIWT